jgi:uncharacterized protein YndB with AHSA1/START domain
MLHPDGQKASVRIERHLSDPPRVVWDAITDRDELRTWFPCDVEVIGGCWRVGAAIVFRFSPAFDMTLDGEVLAVDEPSLLSYSWGENILRFELVAEDAGTRLVLIDELPPGHAARNAAGWEECLARLDGRQATMERSWKDAFDQYASAFAAELGPQEGPPASHTPAT